MNNITLIDTHVHYYKFCEMPEFFDSAYTNFRNAANDLGASSFTPVMCLLETGGSHSYQTLLSIAESSSNMGKWMIKPIDDNQSLILTKSKGQELLVLSGKQVITRENLEVIIIGLCDEVPNNKGIEFYLNEYSDLYLVILPWGVGKWLGARGRIINDLLKKKGNIPFVLGDNSGRTALWSRISQFQLARSLGINILPGSDPLPISGQYKKVASFGSVIQGSLETKGILKQVRNKLLKGNGDLLGTYGEVDGLVNFLLSQILLRISPIR